MEGLVRRHTGKLRLRFIRFSYVNFDLFHTKWICFFRSDSESDPQPNKIQSMSPCIPNTTNLSLVYFYENETLYSYSLHKCVRYQFKILIGRKKTKTRLESKIENWGRTVTVLIRESSFNPFCSLSKKHSAQRTRELWICISIQSISSASVSV
jgi:hypothetical protein